MYTARLLEDQDLQMLLDVRGYLVVSTYDAYPVGHVVEQIKINSSPGQPAVKKTKVVVVAKTDRADFVAQHVLLNIVNCYMAPDTAIPNYYRVVAD